MPKCQIKNRWTGNVQVEVEIDASFAAEPIRVQLGAAVKPNQARKVVNQTNP